MTNKKCCTNNAHGIFKHDKYVFIAKSLDGYIADKAGKIDWLHEIPNPDKVDCGFANFMKRVDAIVMGRRTFETVMSFECEWPYSKPVFVLSNSLKFAPEKFREKAELVHGSPIEIVNLLNRKGFKTLYIDGGITIQSFLKANLINEMIITLIPILLGGGTKLFDELPHPIKFEHLKTEIFLDSLVQSHYIRKNL